MGQHGLNALIASGVLRRLKHLRLQLLPLGDQGVAALAPALGKYLQTLELLNVYCKGEGAAALLRSPCMPSLRHLDLSANRIDAKHFVQMAEVGMPHLQSLDLSGPRINPYYWNVGQQPLLDAGAAAWARSPNAKHLKSLRLQNCHLTDEALTEIFRSSQLRSLEQLDLSHNRFSAAAISQAVVGSPLWQTLKDLGLNNCGLDNPAIAALSRVVHAPALRSLQLAYNSVGPNGAAALANWPVLARVWHLDLHDNFIGDEGLISFARSSNLGRLVELDLEQDCWNVIVKPFRSRTMGASVAAMAV
jgi:Ran GTPase-activating protein (RanGAP) involved in mRNA processing and transport